MTVERRRGKRSFLHKAPAPTPTVFTWTGGSNTDPQIQPKRRWETGREGKKRSKLHLSGGWWADKPEIWNSVHLSVTQTDITVRKGLEASFSSHHEQTEGLDCRQCPPDCMGALAGPSLKQQCTAWTLLLKSLTCSSLSWEHSCVSAGQKAGRPCLCLSKSRQHLFCLPSKINLRKASVFP